MKYEYELIKTANQMFNTNIGENNFEFRFRTFRGITYVDLKINGERASASVRALPNASIFNDTINNIAGGKFMFECQTDDYPHFENFDGIACRFVFIED